MSNLNKDFWNKYYEKTNDKINTPSTFGTFVFENYLKNKFQKIADLGCGNCRDSKFFSEQGNKCYAIDYNGVIDKDYSNLQLIK